MKHSIIAIIMAFAISACTTTLYHETKTDEDFQIELYECETIANQRTADMGQAGNIFIVGDETRKCMIRKYGWTVVPGGQ